MILAASNLKGYIKLFPMNDLFTKETDSNFTTPISEVLSLKPTDTKINSIRFSPFKENLIAAAQDDSFITLYDINN